MAADRGPRPRTGAIFRVRAAAHTDDYSRAKPGAAGSYSRVFSEAHDGSTAASALAPASPSLLALRLVAARPQRERFGRRGVVRRST